MQHSDLSEQIFFQPIRRSQILLCLGLSRFSHNWHRLHVFPRLASLACFPALKTSYIFSRAWHRLLVFPRLPDSASHDFRCIVFFEGKLARFRSIYLSRCDHLTKLLCEMTLDRESIRRFLNLFIK